MGGSRKTTSSSCADVPMTRGTGPVSGSPSGMAGPSGFAGSAQAPPRAPPPAAAGRGCRRPGRMIGIPMSGVRSGSLSGRETGAGSACQPARGLRRRVSATASSGSAGSASDGAPRRRGVGFGDAVAEAFGRGRRGPSSAAAARPALRTAVAAPARPAAATARRTGGDSVAGRGRRPGRRSDGGDGRRRRRPGRGAVSQRRPARHRSSARRAATGRRRSRDRPPGWPAAGTALQRPAGSGVGGARGRPATATPSCRGTWRNEELLAGQVGARVVGRLVDRRGAAPEQVGHRARALGGGSVPGSASAGADRERRTSRTPT